MVRWFDHKGKRYASLRACGFECRKGAGWVASPERAMRNWNRNRKFNKSPIYPSLRVELSENQCEIEATFRKESTFLRKGERYYSRLMGCDDEWVGTGKENLPVLGMVSACLRYSDETYSVHRQHYCISTPPATRTFQTNPKGLGSREYPPVNEVWYNIELFLQ